MSSELWRALLVLASPPTIVSLLAQHLKVARDAVRQLYSAEIKAEQTDRLKLRERGWLQPASGTEIQASGAIKLDGSVARRRGMTGTSHNSLSVTVDAAHMLAVTRSAMDSFMAHSPHSAQIAKTAKALLRAAVNQIIQAEHLETTPLPPSSSQKTALENVSRSALDEVPESWRVGVQQFMLRKRALLVANLE